MTLSPEQQAMLKAPLDPKHVVAAKAGGFGPKGDYLEGWHVINELNRVFGFDGWSYRIDLTRDALERADGKDQWQAAYTCICTLFVGDVTRQDVGFGSGFAKGIGDAIEGATKEAVTDALKRCARTFGNIFGLALYDKTRANVQAPLEEMPDHEWARLVSLVESTNTNIPLLLKALKVTLPGDNLRLLSQADYPRAINALESKLAKMAKEETEAKAKEQA
jgi:DNA recombination protein Rad52